MWKFCAEYEDYIHFWKDHSVSNQKKQCFYLSGVLYDRHFAYPKMAAIKQVFVNISACKQGTFINTAKPQFYRPSNLSVAK